MEPFKDKDWLYQKYFEEGLTSVEVAEMTGTYKGKILYCIKKFNIPKPPSESELEIEILCHNCKEKTTKSFSYLKQRLNEGKYKFFCSRKCADKFHSEQMKGENNPNFGGEFHGTPLQTLDEETRKEVYRKISETMKSKGVTKGENNPRWIGGKQKVNCVVCSKEYEVSPYKFRLIQSGEVKPLCNLDCKRMWALKHMKTKRTSIEIKMAEELDKRGIEYEEQFILGNKFALDFYLPEYNVAIECDGDYWHNIPEVKKRDKSKNAYVKKCGINLFRFWEHEINDDVSVCVDRIFKTIS